MTVRDALGKKSISNHGVDYRIYGRAIHLDLIDGKVWLQNNSTEILVNRELIKRGIAPQDIVLGFRSPNIREKLVSFLQQSYKTIE